MRITLRHIIACIAMIFNVSLFAQLPEIPSEYEWTAAEDYKISQDHVEKCLKWLCTSPLGEHVALRSETNAYVMLWLSGTPDFTLHIDSEKLFFLDSHPELLYTYIHGYAYYLLSHRNALSNEKADLEGYKVVCELALRSDELSKDRSLRQLLKAYKKGELKVFIQEQKQAK